MLSEVLSVVADFCPHIVYHERFSEVVFVVRVGHGLEVEGHSGAGLNIAELVASLGSVAVSVKEFGKVCSVLREVRVVSALLPFLIVINNVVGCRGEQFVQSLVLKDGIENINFINSGFHTLVTDASSGGEGEETEMDFPDKSLSGHQKAESSVSDKGTGPCIVAAAKTSADLVDVVGSTHTPFPVVVSEEEVGVLELSGVTVCLGSFSSIRSMDVSSRGKVNVVLSLRRLVSKVIETSLCVFPESTGLGANHGALLCT